MSGVSGCTSCGGAQASYSPPTASPAASAASTSAPAKAATPPPAPAGLGKSVDLSV